MLIVEKDSSQVKEKIIKYSRLEQRSEKTQNPTDLSAGNFEENSRQKTNEPPMSEDVAGAAFVGVVIQTEV